MTSKIEISGCCFVATSTLMPLLLTLDTNFSVSKMIGISINDNLYNVTAYLNTKESEHLFIKFLNDNMIDHEITFFD